MMNQMPYNISIKKLLIMVSKEDLEKKNGNKLQAPIETKNQTIYTKQGDSL